MTQNSTSNDGDSPPSSNDNLPVPSAEELSEEERQYRDKYSENGYIGWIPCISGKLDFDLFKVGMGDDRLTIVQNDKSLHDAKKVFLYAVKDWKDRDDKTLSGKAKLFVIGNVLNGLCFEGHIYCFRDKPDSKDLSEEERDISAKVANLKQLQSEVDAQEKVSKEKGIDHLAAGVLAGKQDEISTNISALETEINNQTSNPDVYICKALVLRGGICYLNYLGDEADSKPNSTPRIVSRQLFYFLKYALHQHKHHAHEQDCLTTIFPMPEKESDIGRTLVDDLIKNVIRLKRRFDTTSYSDTKHVGILSYTRALVISSQRLGFLKKPVAERKLKEIDNISMSFKALLNRKELDANIKQGMRAGARSVLSIIIAIVALSSLLSLNIFQIKKESPPEWIKTIVASPIQFVLAAIVTLVAVYFAVYLYEANYYVGNSKVKVKLRKYLMESGRLFDAILYGFIVLALCGLIIAVNWLL